MWVISENPTLYSGEEKIMVSPLLSFLHSSLNMKSFYATFSAQLIFDYC